MPRIQGPGETQNKLPNDNFGYSAVRLDGLGATEYTIVSIAVDDSGSVGSFKADMEKAIKEVVQACKHSPRADNLLLRLVKFSSSFEEVHGFKELASCNLADYDGILACGGATSLFDAADNIISATSAFGKDLLAKDFSVNGLVVVITDGEDNNSKHGVNDVKKALSEATKGECLESLVSILIGVNVQDSGLEKTLKDIKNAAGFTQFVPVADASSKTLAKLAAFISKSISAQSQAIGSGGPSKSLTF